MSTEIKVVREYLFPDSPQPPQLLSPFLQLQPNPMANGDSVVARDDGHVEEGASGTALPTDDIEEEGLNFVSLLNWRVPIDIIQQQFNEGILDKVDVLLPRKHVGVVDTWP